MKSLPELASEILANTTIVSWDGIRHVCRLLLADADYNCAAADSKERKISSDPRLVVEVLQNRLADVESVYQECERAWVELHDAERPRGAFEVWHANDARFCSAIERCTKALEALREKHYRVG